VLFGSFWGLISVSDTDFAAKKSQQSQGSQGSVFVTKVKEFDCNLTREMVDLIDREADMLNRGRPEKSFAGATRQSWPECVDLCIIDYSNIYVY